MTPATRFVSIAVFTAAVLAFTGCGKMEEAREAKNLEAAKAAYDAMRAGEVDQLRDILAKSPQAANTLIREDSLLNLVIDTRPEYPKMLISIKILLDSGADPNLKAPELLRKSIWRREPEIFQMLLDYGADPLIVWEKRGINMIEYSKSYKDARFDAITDAWEDKQTP